MHLSIQALHSRARVSIVEFRLFPVSIFECRVSILGERKVRRSRIGAGTHKPPGGHAPPRPSFSWPGQYLLYIVASVICQAKIAGLDVGPGLAPASFADPLNNSALRVAEHPAAARRTIGQGLRPVRTHPAKIHPGITMHAIPVKGPAGLLFTIGVLVLFLLGLPAARWFLALSLVLGVVIGVILRLTSRD